MPLVSQDILGSRFSLSSTGRPWKGQQYYAIDLVCTSEVLVCRLSELGSLRTLKKELINELMKGRVHFYSIYTANVRLKRLDYVLKNGVISGNLSNELAMFGAQLSKLFVDLMGVCVG